MKQSSFSEIADDADIAELEAMHRETLAQWAKERDEKTSKPKPIRIKPTSESILSFHNDEPRGPAAPAPKRQQAVSRNLGATRNPVMRLKVGSGGCPVGSYAATFDGCEETTNEQFGAGLRWKWKVTAGPQAGQIAGRTTGTTPTTRNGCGKMLAAVTGKPLNIGDDVDLQEFVGKPYMIIVAATDSGGTRVETAVPVATA